jgi:hypothetical protein
MLCSAHLPPPSVSSRSFEQLRYFWPNRRKLRRFSILVGQVIMSCIDWCQNDRAKATTACIACNADKRPRPIAGRLPDLVANREKQSVIFYCVETAN